MNYDGFLTAAAQLGLTSLIIRPKRMLHNLTLADSTKLPDIQADAILDEHHSDRLEVTMHPVEIGTAISDHAYKHPPVVDITMAWSTSPVTNGNLANAAAGYSAAVSPSIVGTGLGVAAFAGAAATVFDSVMVSGLAVDKLATVYTVLLQMQESRALFDIFTGKRKYKNMICKSISVSTDSQTENVLIVRMECQQILMVSTKILKLDNQTQKSNDTGSTTERGPVQPVAK